MPEQLRRVRQRPPFRGHIVGMGVALAVLAACAPRGALTVAPEAADTGSVVEILAATSRGAAEESVIATRGRSEALRWGRFEIAVPSEREPGTVTFPRRQPPNPRTDFLTVTAQQFPNERAFLAGVNAALAARPRQQREVTVFVHGFNTNFAEGLYRHAQMSHDFQSPGVSVSYSWPSAGSVRSYPFDRESALFARDGLEQLLDTLARSNTPDIVLAGHSMGSFVVMEAVRQLSIRGADRVLNKLQAVILMSPDLDIDVFRTQVAALAPREVPIYIVVSGRDRALRISGLLRGEGERLGSIQDVGRVADLPGVVILDVTDVQGSSDPLNHFAVATSPAMIAFISGLDVVGAAMFRDEARQTNVFQATVGAVAGVTEVVFQPQAR